MKQAIGLLVAVLLWSTSETMAATVEVTPGVGSRMVLQVWSMHELKVRSVVLQKYDYSCGSAALATLLTYHYGYPITEELVFRVMFEHGDQQKIQQEGFSLMDMKRFLTAHGFPADGFTVSLDDVSNAGIPVIVLLVDNGYHHFVVVKGMRGNKVLIGDPAVGMRVIPREQFEASWPTRIAFAIHHSSAQGVFNIARDWSVRPLSLLGEPLSPNLLSNIVLFRPGGGDF